MVRAPTQLIIRGLRFASPTKPDQTIAGRTGAAPRENPTLKQPCGFLFIWHSSPLHVPVTIRPATEPAAEATSIAPDLSQPGVPAIVNYLEELPRPIAPNCDKGHYYILNTTILPSESENREE